MISSLSCQSAWGWSNGPQIDTRVGLGKCDKLAASFSEIIFNYISFFLFLLNVHHFTEAFMKVVLFYFKTLWLDYPSLSFLFVYLLFHSDGVKLHWCDVCEKQFTLCNTKFLNPNPHTSSLFQKKDIIMQNVGTFSTFSYMAFTLSSIFFRSQQLVLFYHPAF